MARTARPSARSRPKPDPQPAPDPLKRGRGQPTDYDPSFCHEVVEASDRGYSLTGFAGLIGVSRRTITNWMDTHPEFLAAVEIAKAVRAAAYEGKAWDVASGNGGPGAAQMIQFTLKNLAPDEYADTQNHRLSGANGGPIQTVDLTRATDDQLAALEAVFGPLAAAGGDAGADQD